MDHSSTPGSTELEPKSELTRRDVIHRGLAGSLAGVLGTWVAGCGSNREGDSLAQTPSFANTDTPGSPGTAPTPPAGGSTPSAPVRTSVIPLATGKYRVNQDYLFQSSATKLLPPRLPGGQAFLVDRFGPNHKYVDMHCVWPWTQPGGDWIDANRVRHGSAPWFSVVTDKGPAQSSVVTYEVDVTRLVQFAQTEKRWLAIMLFCRNAPRVMAARFHRSYAAPSIAVTYADGSREQLPSRTVAASSASSLMAVTTAESVPLPAFLEFKRPRSAVSSATLSFVITEHWSGRNPEVTGFLIDPQVNADAVSFGIADEGPELDQGIEQQPGVLGAHRYADGTSLQDYVHPTPITWTDERNFDPAIFGTGPRDTSKLPHVGLGRWINTSNNWSMVDSAYRGNGFEPLAAGIGALRIHMPKQPGIADGVTVGYTGTLAANGVIFLPDEHFGLLDRIFIRYYFRLAGPYAPQMADRYHVWQSPGQSEWTTMAGKFGIGPDHNTSYGGVSGSSGGNLGWQMRLGWEDCDAGTGGPDEPGIAPSFHLFDYNYANPPGHNYGKEGTFGERWGQRGGLGGMIYPDRWYCIETEMKLNTARQDGTWLPDGALRAWIDGRLVYERTSMVFRTLPVFNAAFQAQRIRPCRELGIRNLWLNWFHGGKSANSIDRTTFYTGLVWSRNYIGPMKGVRTG